MYSSRVLNVARETDLERLRQMALLLERENARLHQRLLTLTRELAEARGADRAQLELELRYLTEQLAARNHQLFGPSSERRGGPRDEPRPRETPRGHGPRPQPTLPLVEVTHTLDAADQVCPQCGGDLQPWDGQTEDAEEIDVVERHFQLVRHRRQKYRCGCGSCIDTALGPPKLQPGGRYSIDFAVAVAVGKYLDHLPLARQVRQMARQGLQVDSQTLWDQLNALARHLAPTYAGLAAYVRAGPVVGADETTWQLMLPGKTKRWWVWSLTRPDAVYYELADSRSGATAQAVLGAFRGIVMCDGYGAYRTLTAGEARAGATITLAHCWSHVRRAFVEAAPHYPVAEELLDQIGALYAADAVAHTTAAGDPARLVAERQRTVQPIVTGIHRWLTTQPVLPRSALGKAIGYALGLWAGLTAFLDHAAIPLDNNATERALRGPVVGRRNHYGSRSERGTQVAAVCYSLLESAKLAGVEPAAYLAEATRRAIANPGTITLPRDLLDAPSA